MLSWFKKKKPKAKRCTKVKKEPQAQKHDAGKIRLELFPPEFHRGVSEVLTRAAAEKYSAGNWATGKGLEYSRLIGAAERHLQAWKQGDEIDPEFGLSHLYHAGCMLAFLAASYERGIGIDDREEVGMMKRKNEPSTD